MKTYTITPTTSAPVSGNAPFAALALDMPDMLGAVLSSPWTDRRDKSARTIVAGSAKQARPPRGGPR